MKKILFLLAVFAVAGAFFMGNARTALSAEDVPPVQMADLSSFDLEGGTPLGSDEPFEKASADMEPAPYGSWTDDVRINNSSDDRIKPSMTSLPNGHLYVAVEDRPGSLIVVYKSTDGGESWSIVTGIQGGDELVNPSIAYGENSGSNNKIYVAYTTVYGGNKAVTVLHFDVDDPAGTWAYTYVKSGITLTDNIYPEICTDYLDQTVHYPYVTWTERSIDYAPVYFSRSTNYGVNWSEPANVTGGSENHGLEVRSDIAYGPGPSPDNLYIAFVKPGWNGSSWTRQIWVTISTDFGLNWGTPVQLTSTSLPVYDPRVAAAANVDSVVVAFTKEYSTDTDIHRVYSTNGGGTWSPSGGLGVTSDDEESVELSVSHDQGRFHAAFYRDVCQIQYSWANASSPSSWATTTRVNETDRASGVYSRPAVSVNPTSPEDEEACVAWTDFRDSYYDVFFDSPGLVSNDPVADIKANGSDSPITIAQGANLIVTVELDPGDRSGDNADWWVLADAGGGTWYYYSLSGAWYPGAAVTHQGPLFNLTPPFEVLNMSGLPVGTYTFYFGVDMNMNGTIDSGDLFYDSVTVTIQ
jgi:hypothetical protein